MQQSYRPSEMLTQIGSYDTNYHEMSSKQGEQIKSRFPPGYSGHQRGIRHEHGYGNPGSKGLRFPDLENDPDILPPRPMSVPAGGNRSTRLQDTAQPSTLGSTGRRTIAFNRSEWMDHKFPQETKSPRYLGEHDRNMDSIQRHFPQYEPQSGVQGVAISGGQHPPHPTRTGTMHRKLWESQYKRVHSNTGGDLMTGKGSRVVDPDRPITPADGMGTGFAVNCAAKAGADWTPWGATIDKNTTYRDYINVGFHRSSRKPERGTIPITTGPN
mmetsp:Transcript_37372/g.89887  ORF Transcript_37372/g.89887 Transcript_37372/m.89887 type:complete len:270 (+) Transcript_37372:60-869(+)